MAPRKKIKAEEVTNKEPDNTCDFCKKKFSSEKTLIAHACEKKRRWLWKDEKYAQLGFRAYQMFYEIAQRSKKPKTEAEFIESHYYLGFTKFGRYLTTINAIEPIGFVEFLIRTNVKLDDWSTPRAYEVWVRELGKKEHPLKAIERNVLLMEQWAKETGEEWTDFFRKVNPQLATKWIKSGRLSPWLLFSVGNDLFTRLSDEQLGMVQELLDPDFWDRQFKKYADDVQTIKDAMREIGV